MTWSRMTQARPRVSLPRPASGRNVHERASLYNRAFPPLRGAISQFAPKFARDEARGCATNSILAAQSTIQPRSARLPYAAPGDRLLASRGLGGIARFVCHGE